MKTSRRWSASTKPLPDPAKRLEENKEWELESDTLWRCRNCGFVYEGRKAPKLCPACKHPQNYFERARPTINLSILNALMCGMTRDISRVFIACKALNRYNRISKYK